MSSTHRDWLRPVLAPLVPLFREVLALSLFVNLLALAAPVFVLQVYDRVIGHGGLTTLQALAAGMVLLVAFDFLLRQARSRLLQGVALAIDVEVGRRLQEKLAALPLPALESRPQAFFQGLYRDVETLRNTLSGASAVLAADLPFLLLFLGLVFVLARPIAWVMVTATAAFALLAWWSERRLDTAGRDERHAQAARDALVAETIQARATVKALSLGPALGEAWERRHAAALAGALRRGRSSDRHVNLGIALTTLTTVAMTSIGALAIVEQRMTVGALVAANMLTGRLLGPLNQLVGSWRAFGAFRQAVARLGAVLSEPAEPGEPAILHQRPQGRLALDGVTFAHSADRPPAVEAVSAEMAAGGITAVLGRNGSGKTTLVRLLLGLYRPQAGRVLLDGADLRQFTRRELAGWIGHVPQETVLLAGTIRDNLAHGSPGAPDEAILAAARLAGVHDLVTDLPQGYATPVGEAGARLSGGMRQRLAIARALVGDPPVLILDEPSASLDRQAEEDLARLLAELAVERTVVVVTHAPVLLARCRQIVVLERGRLLARGPADTLLPRLFGGRAAA